MKKGLKNENQYMLTLYHGIHCTQTMILQGEAAENPRKLSAELAHDAGVKHYKLEKFI